ncbi:MAG: 3-isopropylmalate dehydratase small subunit [Spirochaetaceae bacterium]|nr:MAG: 3-isopropylmalate dehydratase small subunit [Spirochaetaceae bacterium]
MNEIKQAIKTIRGRGIVIRGNDIDTDQIIPARFMKVVTFDGLGEYAFFDLRYDEEGKKKSHPFNEERYQGAGILIVNRNFGCGSSREHAPQALMRAGIRAVIGESFAEIFGGNCTAMGVPTVVLSGEDTGSLMQMVEHDSSLTIEVDLPSSTVRCGERTFPFEMHPAYRSALIAGNWDSTSVLLSNVDSIESTARRIPYLCGFSTPAKK